MILIRKLSHMYISNIICTHLLLFDSILWNFRRHDPCFISWYIIFFKVKFMFVHHPTGSWAAPFSNPFILHHWPPISFRVPSINSSKESIIGLVSTRGGQGARQNNHFTAWELVSKQCTPHAWRGPKIGYVFDKNWIEQGHNDQPVTKSQEECERKTK